MQDLGALMPSNAQHHLHLPAQEWQLQLQHQEFTTYGSQHLKDSMILLLNSWKCFKKHQYV